MLAPAGKCEEVQEVSYSRLQYDIAKLLPQIPKNTNLQLDPNTNPLLRSIPDVDIPEEARNKLQKLLNMKCIHICPRQPMDQPHRAGYLYRRSTDRIKAIHSTTEVS